MTKSTKIKKLAKISGPRQRGSVMIFLVVVIFIFSAVMVGLLSYATMQVRLVRQSASRESAFQIAEAGVDYYKWHLAHFQNDYWDGNASSTPGPYLHDYIDKDLNQKVGQFSLQITPPQNGSTIVTIKSTGSTVDNPQVKRSITIRYGIPSLAKYAFLTNTDIWIGSDETVSGEMHANGGIRFDGTGNAPITSAKTTYTCQTYHGCGPTTKPGIWGTAPESTKAFWQFPVPNVDFSSLTSDFQSMENLATGQADLPPSGGPGYSLVFNGDGTVSVYKVTGLIVEPDGSDVNGQTQTADLDYAARTLLYTMNIPQNGVIFVKDNAWVEGTVKGRVVVAATKYSSDPSHQARILIPNNIVYAAKDGTNSLGLIAEKDILITYNAPLVLEIDAALIAQKGSAQWYNFTNRLKTSITIYGTVASFGVWTWTWVSGGNCISGYCNTSTVYDGNLLYSPPPSFPVDSAAGYQQLSWDSD